MDERYEHVQSVGATTWTIDHTLDSVGAIDCYINESGNLSKAFPLDVTHISATQLSIVWSTAYTGKVLMSGKSAP